MRQYFQRLKQSILQGDWVLLLLCVFTSAFSCLMTASTTNYLNTPRYVIMQILGTLLGILFFTIVSSLNVDFFMEHRNALVIFNVLFLSLLFYRSIWAMIFLSPIGMLVWKSQKKKP